jgi:hypothetical protein
MRIIEFRVLTMIIYDTQFPRNYSSVSQGDSCCSYHGRSCPWQWYSWM